MSKFAMPESIKPSPQKTKTYIFTAESLAAHDDEVRRKTMPDATYVINAMYSIAMLLGVRDELGFGKDRLARIFTRIKNNFAAVVSGHVNYYDMAQMLRDECKINIVLERPDGVTVPADDIYRAVSGMPIWKVIMK